ncbi:MAG: TetR/AcrR family transcriptional regulator [Trueperaceae bacterium]
MDESRHTSRTAHRTTRATTTATRTQIVDAAERVLREDGFASVSTRKVADEAGVPLSQIHYHFGSKQKLMIALLEHQNDTLIERQATMYGTDAPLWRQWERACDFYDEDLASGYVRVLQEMTAAGWSDPEIGAAVRAVVQAWTAILRDVATRAEREYGSFGPLSAFDVATLVSVMWLGAESMDLLGMADPDFDIRGALRRVGTLLRDLDASDAP